MNLGADREGGPRSGQARDFPRPENFRRLTIVGKTNPCKRVIRKLAPTVCGNITALRAVLLLQRGDISSGGRGSTMVCLDTEIAGDTLILKSMRSRSTVLALSILLSVARTAAQSGGGTRAAGAAADTASSAATASA